MAQRCKCYESQLMVLKRTWLSSKVFTLLATNPSSPLPMLSLRIFKACLPLMLRICRENSKSCRKSDEGVRKARRDAGVTDIHIVIEMGNQKPSFPYYSNAENVDLILVGAAWVSTMPLNTGWLFIYYSP